MKRKMPLMKHVMTPFPYSIPVDAPMVQARDMMIEHDLRHLPVVDHHVLVGVITERDVSVVLSLGSPIAETSTLTVGAICSKDPFTCDSHTDVASVALHMAAQHLGCVIVTHHSKIAGIFTHTDACRFLGEHLRDLYGPAEGDPEAA